MQVEQQLTRYAERVRRHRDEQQLLAIEPQQLALQDNQQQQAILQEQQAQQLLELEELQQQQEQYQQSIQQLSQQVEQQGLQQQRLVGQQASLQALQDAALGADNQQLESWLAEQQLSGLANLAEQISVSDGWESMVEALLGAQLQSYCVDQLPFAALVTPPADSISFMQKSASATATDQADNADFLLSKISSAYDLTPWLGKIRIASSLTEAQALLATLKAGESLVTQEGYWLSQQFVRYFAEDAQQGGILQRAKQLQQLEQELTTAETLLSEAKQTLALQHHAYSDLQQTVKAAQQQLQQLNHELTQQSAQASILQARIEQLAQRDQQLQQEISELEESIEIEQEQLAEARLQLELAIELMAEQTLRKEALEAQREALAGQVQGYRQQAQQAQQQAHQLALQLNTLQGQQQSIAQALVRLQQQVERATVQHQQIQLELSGQDDPVLELQALLEEQLAERLMADEGLREQRQLLEQTTEQLRTQEQQRLTLERQVEQLRDTVQQARLAGHEVMMRRNVQQEQLQESGFDLAALLELLEEQAQASQWETKIAEISQAIER